MENSHISFLPFPLDPAALRGSFDLTRICFPLPQVISLTWSAAHKQFKKCIGTHQSADGKIRPRIFWLGGDQLEATFKARMYLEAWQIAQRLGQRNWSK